MSLVPSSGLATKPSWITLGGLTMMVPRSDLESSEGVRVCGAAQVSSPSLILRQIPFEPSRSRAICGLRS